MRRAATALCFALLAALAGCAERADPKAIEGHWVAEKFRVKGIGLPIGPDLHITQDQLGLGGDVAPVKLRGIAAEGKEVTLQTEIGLDIVFAFENSNRMYFSIPFTGDRIYYHREQRGTAAVFSPVPSERPLPRVAANASLSAQAKTAVPVQGTEPSRSSPAAGSAVVQAPIASSSNLAAEPVVTPESRAQITANTSEAQYELALQAMGQGDRDASLRKLSAALADGFSDWRRIDAEPLFAVLADDIRFQVLRSRWKKS